MLGIGNIVTAGSKVANVVRNGLQAWYKADQTQAPLSEEKIDNPNFSLGPNVDLLDHTQWYRNNTSAADEEGDFISHGNSDTPFVSGTTGITLTEHGFRFRTIGTSTFIAVAQSNIMNSAAANEETLMLTYDILQNSGSGLLFISMSSNDTALDVTVGSHVKYFTPTTNTFQIKRGGSNLDVTIANIRLVKTNPTIRGNKWTVSKRSSQDMTCSFADDSDLINHPVNTNLVVGMTVQGSGVPGGSTISEINVDGNNTQFRFTQASNKTTTSAQSSVALRIRAASTVHVEDGTVLIDYKNTDNTNTSVSVGNKIKLNQKYQVEVIVDELDVDQKLKIQTGNTFNHLSLGVNTFEMMSTVGNTISLARSFDSTSVTARVSKVSLKEITNSVKDFSPNSNDAVLYSGTALNFDNGSGHNSDYIDTGIIPITYPPGIATNKNTIATWFNASQMGDHMIFSTGQSSSPNNNDRTYLWTKLDGGVNKLRLGWGNNPGTTLVSGSEPTIQANRWYRVVVVLDGLIASVYLDGEFQYSKESTTNFISQGALAIGRHGPISNYYFIGKQADFQVYDKAWTASDVEFDYNNPDKDVFDNSSSSILPTDCLALYRLNEGAGDRLYNAAPVLSEELVLNNDFSGGVQGDGLPNNWEHHANNTSTAEVGTFKGKDNVVKIVTQGDNTTESKLAQNFTFKNSTLYSLEVEVFIESGNLRVDTENSNFASDFILNSNTGTWQTLKTIFKTTSSAAGSGDHIFIRSSINTASEIYVNKISIKEITPATSVIQNSWVASNWITEQPYVPQYAMSSYSKKINFTGIDEKVDLGSTQTIADNEPASISFWYAIGANNSSENYILGTNTGNDYLRIDNQNESLLWRMNGSGVTFDFPDLSENKLSHICITRASGNQPDAKCYVNGVLASSYTNSDNPGGSDGVFNYRYIGSYGSTTSMTAFVDELAIFNKELSQAEVIEIFNRGKALDIRDHSCYYGDEIIPHPDLTNGLSNTTTSGTVDANHKVTATAKGARFQADTNQAGMSVIAFSPSNSGSAVVSGKAYRLEVVISEVVSGSVKIDNGSVPNTGAFGSVGTHVRDFIATGNNASGIVFYRSSVPTDITIQSVSLKEVKTVGYWRNNGVETWNDLSPYGNNGTVNGTPQIIKFQEVPLFNKDTFGLPMNRVRQRALNFDGESYVEINDHNSLDLGTGPFTIEAWAKAKYVDKGSTVNVIFSLGGSVSNATHNTTGLVMFSTGKFGAYVDGQNFDADDVAVEGLWYHVAVRRNSSGVCNIYINGEQQTDHAPTITNSITNTLNPRIGADSNLQRCYHSLIDDIRVYNRLLSTAQIKTNYNVTKSKHKDNIVSNWSDDFDDSFI